MLAVRAPAREANRSRPCMRQVSATVSMAPANRAPLPDCVPKLPLRHRTARPDGAFDHDVGELDPGDIQGGPEGRPQVVGVLAHPSHPGVSRPDTLGQELTEPGPVGEEGPLEAPGLHPGAGADATTGDETLDVPGELCPAHLRTTPGPASWSLRRGRWCPRRGSPFRSASGSLGHRD